ncbi:MAG: hypothetical protein VYD87_08265 [Pseudomonadota bacterium]|nr:hypothetical protein [Pseudomonadota bacterium]MEE3099348.1 hypothetical protein [Pseudomonadota bacterium]
MRLALVLLCLLLAGCDTPSPRYLGAERMDVTHEGVDYIVYRIDDRVQVIRLGSALGVPPEALVRGFRQAARQATGCRIHKVYTGFQVSVIDLRLLCGRTPAEAAEDDDDQPLPPARPAPQPAALSPPGRGASSSPA